MEDELEAFGLVCFYGFGTVNDIKTKQIKTMEIVIFAILGLFINILEQKNSVLSIAGGICVGVAVLIFSILSNEKIGKGDAFVIMVTGLYLGFLNTVVLLWFSSILAAIAGIILVRKYDNKDYEIPFIPFLMMGYLILLFIQMLRGIF